MALKQSFYDGGKRYRKCERCGISLLYPKHGIAKCGKCTQEIADEVSREFEENKEQYLTDAVLTTKHDKPSE